MIGACLTWLIASCVLCAYLGKEQEWHACSLHLPQNIIGMRPRNPGTLTLCPSIITVASPRDHNLLLACMTAYQVAIKRLRGFESVGDEPGPSPTMTPVFSQFFEREIEILATIRHPNVVNFIGACHTPPNVCLVTEYCARGSLDHLLHKSGGPGCLSSCMLVVCT